MTDKIKKKILNYKFTQLMGISPQSTVDKFFTQLMGITLQSTVYKFFTQLMGLLKDLNIKTDTEHRPNKKIRDLITRRQKRNY